MLLLICWGPALSFSLGDVALELESSLLINSKSAHWGEDRTRIEKDNKGEPCSLHFTQLHLSPLTLLHRPLALRTLWMSPCKHKATCYSPSLDCVSVFAVCCPSTIHYQHGLAWIHKQNHNTSSCHTLLFRSHKPRNWNRKSIVYSQVLHIFKSAFSRLYKFEELFTIILLNSIVLNKHITSSTVVWIGKWYDVADWLSKDSIWFQWIS